MVVQDYLNDSLTGAGLAAWRTVADRALDLVESPEAHKLIRHWQDKGTEDRPPGRRDLDPTGFVRALPYVWLMDFFPNQRLLRYRLVGEEIAQRYPDSLLGKHLEDVVDERSWPKVSEYFLACTERPAIALLLGRIYQECQKPGEGERILLPLMGDDGRAEGLIGMTICHSIFDSRKQAPQSLPRRMVILPLDGSATTDRIS